MVPDTMKVRHEFAEAMGLGMTSIRSTEYLVYHFQARIINDVLKLVEAKRQQVLANPNDPSWTEHFAELQNEIKSLQK